MSNAEIIKAWFERVWCAPRSDEAIDELMSSDCELGGVGPAPMLREDFKRLRKHALTRFPDIHFEVTHAVEMGEQVAAHVQVVGTHSGTGRPVAFRGTLIAWVRDDQIVKALESWDFASMFVQIGHLPEASLVNELLGESQ